MIKKLTIVVAILFFAFAARASDLYYPSSYFKASMGYSKLSDYNDASGDILFKSESLSPINIGYGVNVSNLSFDGELGLNYHDFDFLADDPAFSYSGDIIATTLMANATFKTSPNRSGLYLGGGLGAVSVSMESLEDRLRGSSLAVQVFAGFEFKFNSQAALFFEARHIKSLGLELENDFVIIDFDYKQTGGNVGVKYYF